MLALSYDPVEVLAAFAARHGITYPLLADVGSRTIQRLGILNDRIAEERAYWGKVVEDRHRNLPFPGTFLIDEEGVLVEKEFERSHRIRPSGLILAERLGRDPQAPVAAVVADGPDVRVTVWLDSPSYFPNQVLRAHVRLAIADGLHLYVPPVAEGYTPLSVEVSGPDGVFVVPADLPTGSRFEVAGLDEEFFVVEGTVELAIPFYVLENTGDVDLTVSLAYQACDEQVCYLPDQVSLRLPLAAETALP